jgi:hypothetical protein
MDGCAIPQKGQSKYLGKLEEVGLVLLIDIGIIEVKQLTPNLLSMGHNKILSNKAAHAYEPYKSW